MFSLLPIDDPVRGALDAQVRHFSKLVGWANITVAVGVAMEGVELLHDTIAWIKRRRLKEKELAVQKELVEIFPSGEVNPRAGSNSDHPRWVKRFTRIGLIVVVVGVVAEWRCGAKLEDAHKAVHEYDLAKLTEANQKARDAATSAGTAKEEADGVREETEVLKTDLRAASAQLDDFESEVLAVGPRWEALQAGEAVFVKALKPFHGQRVTIVTCANDDTERYALEQMLASSSFPKAGWDKAGWNRWANCPNMLSGGIEMYFVSATNDSAEWTDLPAQQWAIVQGGRFNISHDALNTLVDVLYQLRIKATAWREKPMPQEEGTQRARMVFGGGLPESPAELAYRDPGRIFILVGPNAPASAGKTKGPKKRTPSR
jgi:hypothetical protein